MKQRLRARGGGTGGGRVRPWEWVPGQGSLYALATVSGASQALAGRRLNLGSALLRDSQGG